MSEFSLVGNLLRWYLSKDPHSEEVLYLQSKSRLVHRKETKMRYTRELNGPGLMNDLVCKIQ